MWRVRRGYYRALRRLDSTPGKLAVGGCVLALVVIVGRADAPDANERLARDAERALCQGGYEHAMREFRRDFPDVPSDEVAARLARQCAEGDFQVAPVAQAPPMPPSPGCETLDGSDRRPTVVSTETVAAPERPVPYFAPRAGTLPRDGEATVAGVRLPAGSRCPHYWATDDVVPDAPAVAARLAEAFAETGLWPVLWSFPETPDHYALPTTDPRAADGLDPAGILDTPLAKPATEGERPDDPFGAAADSQRYGSGGSVLLLVPVNRPADAIAMLGALQSEFLSEAEITAVVRSWEERFGAVLTSHGPGTFDLVVAARPGNPAHARALAKEHHALTADASWEGLLQNPVWVLGAPD